MLSSTSLGPSEQEEPQPPTSSSPNGSPPVPQPVAATRYTSGVVSLPYLLPARRLYPNPTVLRPTIARVRLGHRSGGGVVFIRDSSCHFFWWKFIGTDTETEIEM